MLLATIIISSTAMDYIKRENLKAQSQKISDQPMENSLESGNVGEVKPANSGESTETPAQDDKIPPVIFNATGIISDIKSDRLIVKGDGSNFADNISRDLMAVLIPETVTFISSDQKISYQGFEGLKYLKIGDKVLLNGAENIRGKTTFKVGTINLIQ